MKIYHYNPVTGEYMGEGIADLSPEDMKRFKKEVWLIPANATSISPPPAETGKIRLFINGQWEIHKLEV